MPALFLCGGRGQAGWGRPFYKGGNENYLRKMKSLKEERCHQNVPRIRVHYCSFDVNVA